MGGYVIMQHSVQAADKIVKGVPVIPKKVRIVPESRKKQFLLVYNFYWQ